MNKRQIKIQPDYGTFPLWHTGNEVGAIDPNDLPLTSPTKERLNRWAEWYDATLDEGYPPDSGFRSVGEVIAFEAEGTQLWQRIQTELGSEYTVAYFSTMQGKLLHSPDQVALETVTEAEHSLAAGRK